MNLCKIGLCLLLLLSAGCTRLQPPGPTPTQAPAETATPAPSPAPETTATPARPAVLRLWLPPQFDPNADSKASALINLRLNEFSKRRAGVRVEVRIKALDGPGGLLDSLAAANAAAPLTLPDLILLPRPALETAALKGLLYSFDEQTAPLSGDDWYPYAQQLARVQNSIFGLPFAGDALILLYRPTLVATPPLDWTTPLTLTRPLTFPAADAQALFTLAQYLSTGVQLQDSEGRPTLDAEALTRVLNYYKDAETAGLMPFWLTQYSTDEQAWQAFTEGSADLAITWTSRFLGAAPADLAAAAIPTESGRPFTLATGWIFAMPNPQLERHPLSIELAQFLTSSDFLPLWTATAGYLPTRSAALIGWADLDTQTLINQIAGSAQVIPPNDLLAALSPALQLATVEVLKEQSDPAAAAQEAVNQVTGQ